MDTRAEQVYKDDQIGLNEAIWVMKALEWERDHPVTSQAAEKTQESSNFMSAMAGCESFSSSQASLLGRTLDRSNFYITNTSIHLQLSSIVFDMLAVYCKDADKNNPGLLYDLIIAGQLIFAKSIDDLINGGHDEKRFYPISMNTLVGPEYDKTFALWIEPKDDKKRVVREIILQTGYNALISKSIPYDMNAEGLCTELANIYPKDRLQRFGEIHGQSSWSVESLDGEYGTFHKLRHPAQWGYKQRNFTYPVHYPRYRLADLRFEFCNGKTAADLEEMKKKLDQKEVAPVSNSTPVMTGEQSRDDVLYSFRDHCLNILRTLKAEHFTFDAVIACMKALMVLAKESNKCMDSMLRHPIKKKRLKANLNELMHKLQDAKGRLVFRKEDILSIFKDEPIYNIFVDHEEEHKSYQYGSLFQHNKSSSKTINCTVMFKDGTKLEWHTLDNGPELDKVRAQYNDHLDRNMTSNRMTPR